MTSQSQIHPALNPYFPPEVILFLVSLFFYHIFYHIVTQKCEFIFKYQCLEVTSEIARLLLAAS